MRNVRRSALGLACALVLLSGCASDDGIDARVYVDGTQSPPPTVDQRRDAQVRAIYGLAAGHDRTALLAMAKADRVAGRPQDPAVALALYTLDRDAYAEPFVHLYPMTRAGVVDDFGSRFAAAHLVSGGADFPVDALAQLAANGNTLAAQRLANGFAVSENSAVAAEYTRQVNHLINANPALALGALAALPVATQLDALSQPLWCASGTPQRLYDVRGSGATDVTGRLRADVAALCAKPQPAKRRAHPRQHPHGPVNSRRGSSRSAAAKRPAVER